MSIGRAIGIATDNWGSWITISVALGLELEAEWLIKNKSKL